MISGDLDKRSLPQRQGKKPAASLVLHKAAWVVPITSPPIEGGAVLARDGFIVEVGSYRELRNQNIAGVAIVDHDTAALMPCLVNVHTHLELSSLRGKISFPQSGFPAWLGEVFSHRNSMTAADELSGFIEGERQLLANGTGLYGDISNGTCGFAEHQAAFPIRHAFREVLGFDQYDLRSALGSDPLSGTATHRANVALAAHACYSTSAELIQQAKQWCRDRKKPYSIHVAEHAEEIEFLQNGTGYCRELLQNLGRWVQDWRPPRLTPVEYLDSLGVLDGETILVHAVHMQDCDWQIVKQRGCSVCFCPRSNLNIDVGQPAIEKGCRAGIRACLGTDSLASNEDLSLFSEAHYVLDRYPELSPEAILFMSTMAGAKALLSDDRFGSLECGKRAVFLSVPFAHLPSLSQLSEEIISRGNQGEWKWVNYPQNN